MVMQIDDRPGTFYNRGTTPHADYTAQQRQLQQMQQAAMRRQQATAPKPTPVIRKPVVKRSTPIKANSSGNYSRPAAPPTEAPGPIVPSIEDFLGADTGYQQQLREFSQALNDFNADVTRRRGSLESDYGLSKKALEDQRLKDLKSLEEDYGARGILRSGLYGKAVGDYETEYGQRSSELTRKEQEALGMLDQEVGQYQSQKQLREQAAREAAIRRRAEQYGV